RPDAPISARSNRTDLWLIAGIIILVGLAFWMIFAEFGDVLLRGGPRSVVEMDQTRFTAETGVHLVLVAMTAGGGMIDLRYQVVDPDKAVVVHDWDNPPTIIAGRTEQELWRTRHDGAHDDEPHAGVVYSHMILNGGGLVQ